MENKRVEDQANPTSRNADIAPGESEHESGVEPSLPLVKSKESGGLWRPLITLIIYLRALIRTRPSVNETDSQEPVEESINQTDQRDDIDASDGGEGADTDLLPSVKPRAKRCRFLRRFFSPRLPTSTTDENGYDYSEPDSDKMKEQNTNGTMQMESDNSSDEAGEKESLMDKVEDTEKSAEEIEPEAKHKTTADEPGKSPEESQVTAESTHSNGAPTADSPPDDDGVKEAESDSSSSSSMISKGDTASEVEALEAAAFVNDYSQHLASWTTTILWNGFRRAAVAGRDTGGTANERDEREEINQVTASIQEALVLYQTLSEVFARIHGKLQERMSSLGKESFAEAFEGYDATDRLFRLVRGSVTALDGLCRVNLADLVRRSAESSREAQEKWTGFNADIEEKRNALESVTNEMVAISSPQLEYRTFTGEEENPDLASLQNLSIGTDFEPSRLALYLKDPIQSIVKPVLQAIERHVVGILGNPDVVAPEVATRFIQAHQSVRQVNTQAKQEYERLVGGFKGLLKQLVSQLNVLESLNTVFDEIGKLRAELLDAKGENIGTKFAGDLEDAYQELEKQLDEALPNIGLERIRPELGTKVDWSIHHPTETRETEEGLEDTIVETHQSGYRFLQTGEMLQMVDVTITKPVNKTNSPEPETTTAPEQTEPSTEKADSSEPDTKTPSGSAV